MGCDLYNWNLEINTGTYLWQLLSQGTVKRVCNFSKFEIPATLPVKIDYLHFIMSLISWP